jgi:hypothetical protein
MQRENSSEEMHDQFQDQMHTHLTANPSVPSFATSHSPLKSRAVNSSHSNHTIAGQHEQNNLLPNSDNSAKFPNHNNHSNNFHNRNNSTKNNEMDIVIHNEKKITICFSGFRPKSSKGDGESIKFDLEKKAKYLGANIKVGEEFDKFITHVISPPNTRTIKTLAACLTGKWVVSSQWIEDSYAQGYWINEENYGMFLLKRLFLIQF